MPYYYRSTSIDEIDFSTRVKNALHRAKIETVGDILDYPEDAWCKVRNFGKTSIQEIMSFLDSMREYGVGFQEVADDAASNCVNMLRDFYLDSPVESLPLRNRARNMLKRAGIDTLVQLQGMREEELLKVPGLGVTSAREIMETLSELNFHAEYAPAPAEASDTQWDELLHFALEASDLYGIAVKDVLSVASDIRMQKPDVRGESFVWLCYQAPALRNALKNHIIRVLEDADKSLQPESILVPAHLKNTNILAECLLEMEREKEVIYTFDHVSRRYPTVLEYVQTIKNERTRDMLSERLKKGDGPQNEGTLEAVGKKWGIERERVRQICNKTLRCRPRLQEDVYRYVFDNYCFSREDFCLAFDEPIWVYNYLDMTKSKESSSRLPLEEALEDMSLTAEMCRKIEKAIYKNYVCVDGVQIPKKRPELVRFYVKRDCRESTGYDSFVIEFNAFIAELGLPEAEGIQVDGRTYENKFQDIDYVLWSRGHSFRYYDVAGVDADQLLAELNLEQYDNLEISALKIYRDYEHVMQRLDIRNEYELHNLLKKLYKRQEEKQGSSLNPEIYFAKMPTLQIGRVDVDGQLLDLLLQYAPVRAEDLAAKYEELYGVKRSTVQGNLFRRIDTYYHNGVFSIEANTLPPAEHSRMKELLSENYYERSEVERIYSREFPNSNVKNINPYTMKMLGFQVFSNYFLKEECGNAGAYFCRILTEEDIFRSEDHSASMQKHPTFSSELNRLKHERTLTEFSPGQYIHIRRLETAGVTKTALDRYCSDVMDYVGSKSFFTVKSMKQDGFRHDLDDYDFDDWFYASVLEAAQEKYQCQRLGGTKLLYSGTEHINFAGFIRWLVEREERIDQYELLERLEKYYGIRTTLFKIIEAARTENLYYNPIMEAIYIDYDTYFEEV